MRKVLLVYRYYHHHVMVERLASILSERGVAIDVFNTDTMTMVRHSDVKLSPLPVAMMRLHACIHRLFPGAGVPKFYANAVFRMLAGKYDIVDFHVYTMDLLPRMAFCASKGIPYDITLWGSDMLRTDAAEQSAKACGFQSCRFIKSVPNVLEKVSKVYGGRFDAKFRTVMWGQGEFESIDALSPEEVNRFRASLCGNDRLIVTCGYNAIPEQQHMLMLNAVASLPVRVKDRLFLVIPMTYLGTEEYKNSIREAAGRTGVPFRLLETFMAAKEVASLRAVSDIVINMQTTDAFAGSLQGHLYAGGVLIVADWLYYPALDEGGVLYFKSSAEELAGTLNNVVDSFGQLKEKCRDNKNKMARLTSWEAVSDAWEKCYKE